MNFLNSFSKIIKIELAMNIALSRNFNLEDMVFVILSPLLPVLLTSFSIGTKKVIFSVFSTKEVNCPSNFSANSIFYDIMMIKVRSIMKNYVNFFRHTVF